MPLPQDTCRLFWVATRVRVKQALKNDAAANDVLRIRLNELSDNSDADVTATRRLLPLRAYSDLACQDAGSVSSFHRSEVRLGFCIRFDLTRVVLAFDSNTSDSS